jgi:hypothetical protein
MFFSQNRLTSQFIKNIYNLLIFIYNNINGDSRSWHFVDACCIMKFVFIQRPWVNALILNWSVRKRRLRNSEKFIEY